MQGLLIVTFDEYWNTLVDRVHRGKEVLKGDEALFWRLSGIRGETYVGGLVGYFGERFEEFDRDLVALETTGFTELAASYREARRLLFDDAILDSHAVIAMLDRFETAETGAWLEQVNNVYTRIVDRIDDLEELPGSARLTRRVVQRPVDARRERKESSWTR